jgi:hypothetical protein
MAQPFRTLGFNGQTGEVTDEVPISDDALLLIIDQVEGWQRSRDGKWSSPPSDPFETAPDPREVGI